MTYDANSITILDEQAIIDRMPWEHIKQLAATYPHIPYEHIKRLIEACDLSGWDRTDCELKYLLNETSIRTPLEMLAIFKELADQRPKR